MESNISTIVQMQLSTLSRREDVRGSSLVNKAPLRNLTLASCT